MINSNKILVTLRNGKKVERTLRINKDGWRYIVYNGYRVGVIFCCGYWYEE